MVNPGSTALMSAGGKKTEMTGCGCVELCCTWPSPSLLLVSYPLSDARKVFPTQF